ncbi:MAG: endonuclease NucS [Sphingomonadaceae bacterium]
MAGQIYEQTTTELMAEWAQQNLVRGQIFTKNDVISYFATHYPKIKASSIRAHMTAMAVNDPNRKHHPSVKPNAGFDVFFRAGRGQYRLWVPEEDGPARYKPDIEAEEAESGPLVDHDDDAGGEEGVAISSGEFAQERDLQAYLAKNLHAIEPGLSLYEEDGLTGIEFDVGGRRIDILAVDKDGALVVIELKVSKGYDRVIGQLLRYMGWVRQNMDSKKPVRGVIIASKITDDLLLATSAIPDVQLVEYEISFSLRPC